MRILVVEDEHRIANTIKKGLQMEKYAVDLAYTGTDGYDLAATEDYDLIVLDRMLPGMDGIKMCRILRQENNHTPILMLTAKGQIEDRVHGLDSGADDYLIKPFAFDELLARVRALFRRPKDALNSTLSVRDITLDTQNFSVKRDGMDIAVSGKEFALLQYLMRNTGKVRTKEQIISHVWDYDADVLPNTVEVNIRNLRNKIDNPFPHLDPLLHTVRGFGYKIE